jgi:hypothetical protein
MSAKPNLRLVKPAIQKRAVAPLRRPNSELRSREHLTETEVEKLIEAAKGDRYADRYALGCVVRYDRNRSDGRCVSESPYHS